MQFDASDEFEYDFQNLPFDIDYFFDDLYPVVLDIFFDCLSTYDIYEYHEIESDGQNDLWRKKRFKNINKFF